MDTVLPLWGVESKITQRGKLKGNVATINFQLGQYGCEVAEDAAEPAYRSWLQS